MLVLGELMGKELDTGGRRPPEGMGLGGARTLTALALPAKRLAVLAPPLPRSSPMDIKLPPKLGALCMSGVPGMWKPAAVTTVGFWSGGMLMGETTLLLGAGGFIPLVVVAEVIAGWVKVLAGVWFGKNMRLLLCGMEGGVGYTSVEEDPKNPNALLLAPEPGGSMLPAEGTWSSPAAWANSSTAGVGAEGGAACFLLFLDVDSDDSLVFLLVEGSAMGAEAAAAAAAASTWAGEGICHSDLPSRGGNMCVMRTWMGVGLALYKEYCVPHHNT
jgi:hypothetical protein